MSRNYYVIQGANDGFVGVHSVLGLTPGPYIAGSLLDVALNFITDDPGRIHLRMIDTGGNEFRHAGCIRVRRLCYPCALVEPSPNDRLPVSVANIFELLEEDKRTYRTNRNSILVTNLLHEKQLCFLLAGINLILMRKPQRRPVRLLTTTLRMAVRAFASVGSGGRERRNLEQR